MGPKSRFDRDLDVWEPTAGTSRFERLDRGLTIVTKLIRDGSAISATGRTGSIFIKMGSYEGTFPSFEIGVTTIGEAIEVDTWPVESLPGKCHGETPIDRFLVEGGKVEVTDLGGRLHATLARTLPERTFVDKKVSHRVYRKGIRKAVGENLLGVVEAALAAPEEVLEGSLMSTT